MGVGQKPLEIFDFPAPAFACQGLFGFGVALLVVDVRGISHGLCVGRIVGSSHYDTDTIHHTIAPLTVP